MKYISSSRLSVYEHHLKVKHDEVLAAYHWNKALCAALFPVIQCLEVTLRNAIDCAIRENPPKAAKGQYSTGPDWIFSFTEYMGNRTLPNHKRYTKNARPKQPVDKQGYVLASNKTRLITNYLWEEKKVVDASKKLKRVGKSVTPNNVISVMDFGFWTNFLSITYEDISSQMLLWPNQLKTVFPNAPVGITRSDIEKIFLSIKELRNRLTHHEAIWKFFYDNPVTGMPDYSKPVYGAKASCSLLLKHYEDILEAIKWMSKDRLARFLEHHGDARFRALCSLDGLHSFISPEKITCTHPINKGGWGVRKLLNQLENGEPVRITRNGKTVYTLAKDFHRSF
ncbi:MAG: Abi family protein [Idiomarina sp.]|nr:Abi family protein [Idiomarina sp.]